MRAEGWYRDPFRLHTDRWFSDGRPTDLVRDHGVESRDAPPPEAFAGPLTESPETPAADGADLLRADDATAGRRYSRSEAIGRAIEMIAVKAAIDPGKR
jgi:hypothetical protein